MVDENARAPRPRGVSYGSSSGGRIRTNVVRVLLVGLIVALCGGCVTNNEGLVPEGPPLDIQKVPEIAALLPPNVRESGKLQVGVNIPYAPNEFKDENGKIVGFDVDIMNAVATVLGVEAVYNQADFDKIIPAIQSGSYDLGMSSFTDSKEREKSVDFVTYYSAGIQWLSGRTIPWTRTMRVGCEWRYRPQLPRTSTKYPPRARHALLRASRPSRRLSTTVRTTRPTHSSWVESTRCPLIHR